MGHWRDTSTEGERAPARQAAALSPGQVRDRSGVQCSSRVPSARLRNATGDLLAAVVLIGGGMGLISQAMHF